MPDPTPATSRPRTTPRGRQTDPAALADIERLLGGQRRERDQLIEHLHAIQDHVGHLTLRHLRALADWMRLPMAEVYETATFYAHFDVVADGEAPPPALTVRVCDSLPCQLAGARVLRSALDGALDPAHIRVVRAPCMGRCDQAPVAQLGHRHLAHATADTVHEALARDDLHAEPIAWQGLADARAGGGYTLLQRLQSGALTIEALETLLRDAGLRGLGGAGFPAWRKWQAVRTEPSPRYLVVNADEGEPGTFKDRHYLERTPHRVLEGTLVAAHAVDAAAVYLYLRDEYPGLRAVLRAAIAELEAAGLAAPGYIVLRRGAGAYICGEESALIESLEGKPGKPRHRPPFVAQQGLFGRPTLVHNVETLYWIPLLAADGSAHFAAQGRRGRSGLRSFSVSGRVNTPGVHLAPAGITLRELVDEHCGGMLDGHRLLAYLPGGASGGILPAALADLPLDFDTLQPHGCFIGSAAVIVLSERDDLRAVAANLLAFFADESCGQCTPCRVGTEKLHALIERNDWDTGQLHALAQVMREASICGLGQAAPNPVTSLLRFFPAELARAGVALHPTPPTATAAPHPATPIAPLTTPPPHPTTPNTPPVGAAEAANLPPTPTATTNQNATTGFAITLDGVTAQAFPGETLWQVALRAGERIPHLCFKDAPGYRADGNCRACMVEIEGERTLAASCIRAARPGMVVRSAHSAPAQHARAGVRALLLDDQPARADSPDRSSHFWKVVESSAAELAPPAANGRGATPRRDTSHPAIHVAHDACISCGLCVRACREVQVNDVIGLAHRGARAKIVFDFDDPLGDSSCVACGECVQACPTGALMPARLIDAHGRGDSAGAERKVDSVCPYCGVGCQLRYHVKDEQILFVEGRNGPANQNRLCVKGRFGFDYPMHRARLTTPLIRRKGAPKGVDPAFDPATPLSHFRPASWDEALDFAAAGLRRLRDTHGPQALAGFGSAKCSNEEAWLFQKLVRTGFRSHNVDHCTRLCHASSVAALMECIGSGAVTASFMQAAQADVVILTGCNPTANHPVAATYFKQAARRGTKLIVLDPRGLVLGQHAHRMVRFTPGSDVALFNAMLNVIVNEGLHDEAYVAAHTEGFAALAAHVAPLTPEAMAPLCGVAADEIRDIARLYAQAERAMIFWGMGISQHTHGTDNARCLISLALATGHIGRPGTGLHPLRGQNNVQGASDAGLIPMMLPDYRPVGDAQYRAAFEELWSTPLPAKPGLTVVETMHAIAAGEVRGMYILGENPAMSDPDLHHTRAALARLEHLVVQDLFVTETAQFADVILPASAWPEKEGTVTNTNRQVQLGRAALPLPGEARPDWWIIQQLARRFGLDWQYTHPREVFAEMKHAMRSLDHIDWDRLAREGAVTYPCPADDAPGLDVVFAERFPTASGRARFRPAAPLPPDEPVDAAWPTVIITGRQLEHWHTGAMTRRSAVLDALEPAAVATLAPAELARLGLAPGAALRIETRRGHITLSARTDPLMPAGMVFVPFCYVEAAANILTNPALDPYGKIPEFKYAACRLAAG
jgi:formate dehydrogenase major subunit